MSLAVDDNLCVRCNPILRPGLIVYKDTYGPITRWTVRHGKIFKRGWAIGYRDVSVRPSGVYVGNKLVHELRPG